MLSIAPSIAMIRKYTRQHSELRRANHFSFDILLPRFAKPRVDVAIFGINQAEYAEDYTLRKSAGHILEDTSLSTVRPPDDPKAARWYRIARSYIGNGTAVLGEFFFWSSRNSGEAFRRCYGDFRHSKHLRFCRDRNRELLAYYRPKAVVALGLTYSNMLAKLYELDEEPSIILERGKRIAVLHRRDHPPWIFVKHWSGAFGLSTEQKQRMKAEIGALLRDGM